MAPAPPFQQYGRIYRTMCALSCWIILIVGIAVLEGGVTAQDPDTMDTTDTSTSSTSTAAEEETNSIAAVFEAADVPMGDGEIPCGKKF